MVLGHNRGWVRFSGMISYLSLGKKGFPQIKNPVQVILVVVFLSQYFLEHRQNFRIINEVFLDCFDLVFFRKPLNLCQITVILIHKSLLQEKSNLESLHKCSELISHFYNTRAIFELFTAKYLNIYRVSHSVIETKWL